MIGDRPCGNCAGTGVAKDIHLSGGPHPTALILDPDDKLFRIKITCKCSAALVFEIPEKLKHIVRHMVRCNMCSTLYVFDTDGSLGRVSPDGSVKILQPAEKTSIKETKPSADSFQASASTKWVN